MSNQTGGVMTNKVWMIGMMLIAFVIGMLSSQNTSAQQGEIGRYQMTRGAIDVNRAFLLDTATGRVWNCDWDKCFGNPIAGDRPSGIYVPPQ
jgi:hypothetical protein